MIISFQRGGMGRIHCQHKPKSKSNGHLNKVVSGTRVYYLMSSGKLYLMCTYGEMVGRYGSWNSAIVIGQTPMKISVSYINITYKKRKLDSSPLSLVDILFKMSCKYNSHWLLQY
jgi:hypothetical protein